MAKEREIYVELSSQPPQTGDDVVGRPRRPDTTHRSAEKTRSPIAVLLISIVGLIAILNVALCFFAADPIAAFERIGFPVYMALISLSAPVIAHYFKGKMG